MTSRCRGVVESHFDIANKSNDILGFTLDPVHVSGDEKGLQDSVPAMDLGLSIKPNNQHISARKHVQVHVPNLLGRNNFCAFYGFPYLDYCYYVVHQKCYCWNY